MKISGDFVANGEAYLFLLGNCRELKSFFFIKIWSMLKISYTFKNYEGTLLMPKIKTMKNHVSQKVNGINYYLYILARRKSQCFSNVLLPLRFTLLSNHNIAIILSILGSFLSAFE